MRSFLRPVAAIFVGVVSLALAVQVHAETPLRIGVVSRTIFYLPAWTAQQQGFFKQEGIEASIVVYDGSDKILADLKSGLNQIGISSIESVIQDAYSGGPMRLVAGSAQRPPHFIIAQSDIKSLAQLRERQSALFP